jgi:predicted NBD/HSP70 family sugar kinase
VHEQFQDLLDELARLSGVGQEVLGEVLARTSLRAPDETSRVEISAGNLAARRSVDQRAIPQGTVSKAVKALLGQGLLEDGEKFLRSEDGRALSPLRLGRGFAIAGVHVEQRAGRPSEVATALVGLDGSQVFGMRRTQVSAEGDAWEQAARLIHRQVTSLKSSGDQARGRDGLAPLRMFGIGVEVGAPVQNGKIMPLLDSPLEPPVDFASMLSALLDDGLGRPVPVVVENDVNALAVLAIHEVHYVESDLVVVSVFDEGVGGGLVMDGRLRRGGNGRAMEIGHLAVGFRPGQEEGPQSPRESDVESSSAVHPGFSARCSCGHFGHVDTLAPPCRIQAMLGDAGLDQLSEIDTRDPEFKRARNVFARSGAALGRALAHVSNTVNPSRVIVYLPGALAEPKPDTVAASYLSAVRQEVDRAFSAGNQPDYLAVRALPARPDDAALLGARAAAVCVLESFIEHALRLDGCTTALRRTATGSFKALKL